jgi:hypothetical protein
MDHNHDLLLRPRAELPTRAQRRPWNWQRASALRGVKVTLAQCSPAAPTLTPRTRWAASEGGSSHGRMPLSSVGGGEGLGLQRFYSEGRGRSPRPQRSGKVR